MEQIQRTRLAILAVAGLLFGGGVYGWVWYNNQKAQNAELEQMPVTSAHLPVRKKSDPLASASSGPTSGRMTATGALNRAPMTDTSYGANGAQKPGLTAAAPLGPGAKPGMVAQSGSGIKPGTIAQSGSGIKPGTIAQSGSGIKPGTIAQSGSGIKPGTIAQSGQPANQLANHAGTTAAGAGSAPPNQTRPAAAALQPTIAARPPVTVPVVKTPPTVPTFHPQVVPPVATAPALIPHNLPVTPAPLAVTPPPVVPPAASGSPAFTAATSAEAAASEAKIHIGRTDPTQPLTALLPFPRKKSGFDTTASLIPPPPSTDDDAAPAKGKKGSGVVGKIKEKLVPPPPPMEASSPSGGSGSPMLEISQLPVPPSKPIIGDQMKIIAVMDDKAVVSFPSALRSKNKWPKYMTLSSGQQFESITLVNISKDGVTIEEDGERSLKPIPNVK